MIFFRLQKFWIFYLGLMVWGGLFQIPAFAEKVPPDDMVLIPEGEFIAGAEGYSENESPVHKVYLDAFYLDKFEVRQKDLKKVLMENPSEFKGDELPVNNVTWYEAKEYCQRNFKRLPTEMEWEKAARAETSTSYYWGGEMDSDYLWYSGNSNGQPQPVGQKKPNAFGLYDMTGNVWEWVADWFKNDYYSSSPLKNPLGPKKGEFKVIRGGSWDSVPIMLRMTYRTRSHPTMRFGFFGFRCAKDIISK